MHTDSSGGIAADRREQQQMRKKRRTFAIISHPDAGKTTLTEKFLLYGGVINQAGSVKGKATSKHAVSDWMEIEKERGISVTSSVLQFNYDGYCINILDTPGHQDFSEDTYRTLMAADSAVMVIDASKGVEAQTRKLFKVCAMRHIPIFTFINKMDRDAKDTFDLLDDIEKELGIPTCPVNWPIGSGKAFKGVYDRQKKEVELFSDTRKGTATGEVKVVAMNNPEIDWLIGDEAKTTLMEEIELLDGASAGDQLDIQGTSKGKGFQGVIKRHGQSRGPMGHGSMYHRRPGSMGPTSTPGRVFKGKKLPGHMGSQTITIQNLEVVRVDLDKNVILVKGSVPGAKGAILKLKTSVKSK